MYPAGGVLSKQDASQYYHTWDSEKRPLGDFCNFSEKINISTPFLDDILQIFSAIWKN